MPPMTAGALMNRPVAIPRKARYGVGLGSYGRYMGAAVLMGSPLGVEGLGRGQGTPRRGRGEVGDRPVAGDELGHDLLDPGAAFERQLDLDGDLAAVDDHEAVGAVALTAAGGGELAVQLALADPLSARMPVEDVQAHVGDRGDVGEHAWVGAPHGVVDPGERCAAAREPDEDRLADEQRAALRPTGALPTAAKPTGRVLAAAHEPRELRQCDGVLLADGPQQFDVSCGDAHAAGVRAPRAAADRIMGVGTLDRHRWMTQRRLSARIGPRTAARTRRERANAVVVGGSEIMRPRPLR